MPVAIIAWMSAIQGLIAVAPDVISFGSKVKQWIADMFSQGLLTADQQNVLHKRVDDICGAVLTGQLPPHWTVEADPV